MAHKSQQLTTLSLLKLASEPIGLAALALRVGDIPHRTLRRWLTNWLAAGVIQKVGQGRATRYQYCNKESNPKEGFHFLEGLDADLRTSVLNQLRDLWTYNSTAIEGNTLTLGDTHFVLEQGLTISGKPLKEHQEVIGHARAIELLYKSLTAPVTNSFLFDLHQAVLTDHVIDIYKPIGHWKVENNGTYAVTNDGTQKFIEYAAPQSVPKLMAELIDHINTIDIKALTVYSAPACYAKIHMGFAHIHPFWDGNGRIARLIANIPLLKAGLPPLIIPQEQRQHYIQTLANYQISMGQLNVSTPVWSDDGYLKQFNDFCDSVYSSTKKLIDSAFVVQRERSN